MSRALPYYATSALLLVALAGCSGDSEAGAAADTRAITAAPVVTEAPQVAPVPTMTTPEASGAEMSTSVAAAPLPDLGETIPYELPEVGIALDYPATWQVIDVAPEIRAGSMMYAITFNSKVEPEGTQRTAPEAITKFDLAIQKDGATSAADAFARRKEALAADPGAGTILSEQSMILPSGLEVVRAEVEGRFAKSLEFVTGLNGYTVIFAGLGEFPTVEAIAHTMRSTE